MKKYVVITTINKPNKNIKKISKLCKKNNYDAIDLVIVNFYPFDETLKKTKNHNIIIEMPVP